MTERIYWLSEKKETTFNNNINHHDLFKFKSVGTKGDHKRAFPVELAMNFIKCFNPKIILDPYMGSGTTAVACEKLNRRWIGIEISEKYCEIAKQRIKNEYDKLKFDFK